MTLFAETLHGCGLSQREAAAFLKVGIDSIKSWSAGRGKPPTGVMNDLHDLAAREESAAQKFVDEWERQGQPDDVEIGLSADGYEAQTLGWPCVGAHRAVIRRVWETLPATVKIAIVPRGSTLTTAGAIDAHHK